MPRLIQIPTLRCGLLIVGVVASERMKSVAYTYFKSVKERCKQYGVRYPFLKVYV